MATKKDNFLRPSEILEKHPKLENIWSNTDIGYLFMLKLVKGKKLARTCLVSEKDVLALYNFRFAVSLE